jgi:hypothetical protein
MFHRYCSWCGRCLDSWLIRAVKWALRVSKISHGICDACVVEHFKGGE